MIKIDHYAITVINLREAIEFYKKLGYSVENIYRDDDYCWATLKGNIIDIELFEVIKGEKIQHIGYSYDDYSDIEEYVGNNQPFYGDSKRESYFISDNCGNEIQFIKSKREY